MRLPENIGSFACDNNCICRYSATISSPTLLSSDHQLLFGRHGFESQMETLDQWIPVLISAYVAYSWLDIAPVKPIKPTYERAGGLFLIIHMSGLCGYHISHGLYVPPLPMQRSSSLLSVTCVTLIGDQRKGDIKVQSGCFLASSLNWRTTGTHTIRRNGYS